MKKLLQDIARCRICAESLDHEPRPVVSVSGKSRILVIGQAPGTKVHASGIPWDDKSGENLRDWMGVSRELFYNREIFGIMPMGFCYPGKGKSGDLPPRKECAPAWHPLLLDQMKAVQLTLLIGSYAQNHYLPQREKTLTETVKQFQKYLPNYFPLVHPSPRNFYWTKKKPMVPRRGNTCTQGYYKTGIDQLRRT